MSIESAKTFLKDLAENEDLRQKFEQADNETRGQIIRDGGYSFTKAEIMEASQGELSDEELEGVAGGAIATIGGALITAAAIIAADQID